LDELVHDLAKMNQYHVAKIGELNETINNHKKKLDEYKCEQSNATTIIIK
jgi:hypothetical protein